VVVVLLVALLLTRDLLGADAAAAGYRRSVFIAVGAAALSAIAAGALTSILLSREIIRPLRQLARSSERIAAGHYDERMAVPASDELAQMAASFNQMAAALAEVEQTRISLIGDVSHELRTPLTSLSGYLEGMLDGVFPCDEETLALMYQETRRMRRLVGDLQTLSRVEAGRLVLALGTFDLQALAQRAAAKLEPQAQSGQIALLVEGPKRPCLVTADPDRVEQILINLLGNALRYSPPGGVVRVTVSRDGRVARVAVGDEGIGIAPEQLPYVFERFYRADHGRSGSGIGLTIARHLAWALGGDLAAASPGPGHGSTFTLTLPAAPGVLGEKEA
jgi:histidine kinase